MKVEIRNNQVKLDGYVNVVQRDSRVLPSVRGKFIEQIEPRTFQKALDKTNNVDLLFNHREDRKLGSTSEGNLTLYEDNIGLRAICTVTDQEVVEKAKNNELRGWSFGFISRSDRWEENGDIARRYVSDMDLLEVSVLSVTPAYIATSIEARNGEEVITETRSNEFENVEVKDEIRMDMKQSPKDHYTQMIAYCKACIEYCKQMIANTQDEKMIACCKACIDSCEKCIADCEDCLKYSTPAKRSEPEFDESVFKELENYLMIKK